MKQVQDILKNGANVNAVNKWGTFVRHQPEDYNSLRGLVSIKVKRINATIGCTATRFSHTSIVVPAMMVMILLFCPISHLRLVDGDEGYYLLAARLVSEGKLPYRDFFFPQMPLIPYVYALWMKMTGISWHFARWLSAVFAVSLGLAIFLQTIRLTGRRKAGLIALLLFSFNTLALLWLTVIKTYALSSMLLFLAFAVIPDNEERNSSSRLSYFMAGTLVGLSFLSRSIFVLAALPFVSNILRLQCPPKNRLARLCLFVCGLLLVGFTIMPFMAASPEGFAFGNFGYHSSLIDFNLTTMIQQKIDLLRNQFLSNSEASGANIQFLILMLLNLVGIQRGLYKNAKVALSFDIVLCMFVATLLIPGAHIQYFVTLVPFLAFNSACAVDGLSLDSRWGLRTSGIRSVRILLIGIMCAYIAACPINLYNITVSGAGVPGVQGEKDVVDLRIDTIKSISLEIDKHSVSGQQVLTWWPGYLVESVASPMPGMENQFGVEAAHSLTEIQRMSLRVCSEEEIANIIRSSTAKLVVVGNCCWGQAEWRALLKKKGYRIVSRIAHTEIYEARPEWSRR
ncbi:MAG: ArnT family glycosyltransferase [Desulfomonilaceae bacterium]